MKLDFVVGALQGVKLQRLQLVPYSTFFLREKPVPALITEIHGDDVGNRSGAPDYLLNFNPLPIAAAHY